MSNGLRIEDEVLAHDLRIYSQPSSFLEDRCKQSVVVAGGRNIPSPVTSTGEHWRRFRQL